MARDARLNNWIAGGRRGLPLMIAIVCLPATATAPRASADPAGEVAAIAADHDLRLASGGPSAAPAFGFVLRLTGKAGLADAEVVVGQAPRGRAMVIRRPADGLVYLYATDGLMAKVDSLRPGGLLVVDGVRFECWLAGDEARGGVDFRARVAEQGGRESVALLDPGSMLRSMAGKIQAVAFDAATGEYRVRTPRAELWFSRRGPLGGVGGAQPTGFRIESFAVRFADGATVSADHITTGEAAPADLAGRTRRQFEAAGVPHRGAAWDADAARGQAGFAPAGFWDDARNVAAAKALTAVVNGRADPAPAATEMELAAADEFAVARRVIGGLGLEPELQAAVDELLKAREARVAAIVADVRAGTVTPADATARVGSAASIGPELRRLAGNDAFIRFAEGWAAANAERRRAALASNPVYAELIPALTVAFAKMELSQTQRAELAALVTGVVEQFERTGRSLAERGVTDPARAKRAAVELTAELDGGLRKILTPAQYRQLEQMVTRRPAAPATRPAAPAVPVRPA